MKNQYQLIETRSGLEEISKELKKEKTLAVDLEADSMYHYKEKVCLIQISSLSSNFVIDPLTINDLSSLQPIFFNQKIKKVFHGADYDIRSLFRDFKFEINNLFDTHLACRFLGFKETGLDAILNKLFGISLNKRYQKKDWSHRPLPEDMIEYAANDSFHLFPLAEILEKDLKKQNRLYWVKEECQLLSQVRPPISNNNPLYINFKGAGSFPPRNLAVLEPILQLRKRVAEKKDKPLFKIFGVSSIIKIVRFKPLSQTRLIKIKALSPTQIEMYGDLIVQAVQEAMKIHENDLPRYPKKYAPSLRISDQNRIESLKNWKDKKAKKLKIDPALVCSKPLITAIAICNPKTKKDLEKIKEMKNWQYKEFGTEIVTILKKGSSPD